MPYQQQIHLKATKNQIHCGPKTNLTKLDTAQTFIWKRVAKTFKPSQKLSTHPRLSGNQYVFEQLAFKGLHMCYKKDPTSDMYFMGCVEKA
jgi:hypothetical protein